MRINETQQHAHKLLRILYEDKLRGKRTPYVFAGIGVIIVIIVLVFVLK